MPLQIGRKAGVDVTARGFNAGVISLLGGWTELRRRRRNHHHWLRVAASGYQRHGSKQSGQGNTGKGESCESALRQIVLRQFAVRHGGPRSLGFLSRRRKVQRVLV
jgi:hypothetical protein